MTDNLSPLLAHYDPNIQWAVHTVELTYQVWDYRATATVELRGNCKGEDILSMALDRHIDVISAEQGTVPTIIMRRPSQDGSEDDELINECDEWSDDEDDMEPDVERWLRRMCVCLRIIDHKPQR